MCFLDAAAVCEHDLIRHCKANEFARVIAVNDAPSNELQKKTQRGPLRKDKQTRKIAREYQESLMSSAMTGSRDVLAAVSARIALVEEEASDTDTSNICQVDGGDSPPYKRKKSSKSKKPARKPAPSAGVKEREVYEPVSVNAPRFSQYVSAVVEAVSDEILWRETGHEDAFEPSEVLKVSFNCSHGSQKQPR